jgi:hypothetical protein
MTESESSERSDPAELTSITDQGAHNLNDLRTAVQNLAVKLKVLRDELMTPSGTVREVRVQVNLIFELAQTTMLSSLSVPMPSDGPATHSLDWDSVSPLCHDARQALEIYESVADSFPSSLKDQNRTFEERVANANSGMSLRAAALANTELLYEKLISLLGGL